MKHISILFLLCAISYSQAGITPASTTLIRQSTSIAHSPAIAYSQAIAPLSLPYTAYSHPIAQPLVTPTFYAASPLLAHHAPVLAHRAPLLSQQSILAQYPGLIFAQSPVFGQLPVHEGISQSPAQRPVEGGSPVIESADSQQVPQGPPQQEQPQGPIQQSPILSGGSPGNTVDDDTVSIESAS